MFTTAALAEVNCAPRFTSVEAFGRVTHPSPFIRRHIGINAADRDKMLTAIGIGSLEQLIDETVPESIRRRDPLSLPPGIDEQAALAELAEMASGNLVARNFIGQGYYGGFTPAVIARQILENPGWYTAYTPYQAEISQGRLEMLLNYQQMVCDITAMPLANASLLDEGTAAAEAMAMARRARARHKSKLLLVDPSCHPQTIAVVQTRARYFRYEVRIGLPDENTECFAALIQYPGSDGGLSDPTELIEILHRQGSLAILATDLLALTLLKPPGEMGADIVIGTSQRFGVPMGFGGPHAAFFAFRDEFKRSAPGRIIGVSQDARGRTALRMAMQTREQHIRREKATSNICTSQVLLANMAAAYAIYHGPEGLREIASRIHRFASVLAGALVAAGYVLKHTSFFDTIAVASDERIQAVAEQARARNINLRQYPDGVGISFDETHREEDLHILAELFGVRIDDQSVAPTAIPLDLQRTSAFLTHEIFNRFHSETEMMRYLMALQRKDLALDQSMIPLGSCTMKLNAAAEMMPVSWVEFSGLHPFAPAEQTRGYAQLTTQLEQMLCACTGYDAMSLQPNAGSQGEYAGLLAIAAWHASRGDEHRDICLIPASAHGTNPASAQMAGMEVIVVACDDEGNVDLADLAVKASSNADRLAAAMFTYPSTHGVFEEAIGEMCELIHRHGGQVYIDGANLNAMVGLADPGKFGGDVSHLNLHKTFCIPHGGGGPGVGPIGVKAHLAPFLPDDPAKGTDASMAISAARYGSASILPIPWMYIRMMGADGLRSATEHAILGANYIATRLAARYPILYRGSRGRVAHECIIDIRPLKARTGISEEDIAKRLIDYGFHAPTMSFPVAGTLMIEPTESESLHELDRFCDAMLSIAAEIERVALGEWPLKNNPLVNAPHTLEDILDTEWTRPYSRQIAVSPAVAQGHSHGRVKYWPAVNRIDNVLGDRNLVCSCPPLSSYQ